MAWSTPRTFAVGEILTASAMNTDVRDNTSFLRDPPRARATRAANKSIATGGSAVVVDFDTEDHDHGDLYDPGGANPERITIGDDGTYGFGASGEWESNSSGIRYVAVRLNGTSVVAADRRPGEALSEQSCSNERELLAADYVEMLVYQNSGASRNLQSSGASPMLWVSWRGGDL